MRTQKLIKQSICLLLAVVMLLCCTGFENYVQEQTTESEKEQLQDNLELGEDVELITPAVQNYVEMPASEENRVETEKLAEAEESEIVIQSGCIFADDAENTVIVSITGEPDSSVLTVQEVSLDEQLATEEVLRDSVAAIYGREYTRILDVKIAVNGDLTENVSVSMESERLRELWNNRFNSALREDYVLFRVSKNTAEEIAFTINDERCAIGFETTVFSSFVLIKLCDVLPIWNESDANDIGEEKDTIQSGTNVEPGVQIGIIEEADNEKSIAEEPQISVTMPEFGGETINWSQLEVDAAMDAALTESFGAHEIVLGLDISVGGVVFAQPKRVIISANALAELDTSANLYHLDNRGDYYVAERVDYTFSGEDTITFYASCFSPYIMVKPAEGLNELEESGNDGIIEEGLTEISESEISVEEVATVSLSDYPLVETEASNDEPLLELSELSQPTLAALGLQFSGKMRMVKTPALRAEINGEDDASGNEGEGSGNEGEGSSNEGGGSSNEGGGSSNEGGGSGNEGGDEPTEPEPPAPNCKLEMVLIHWLTPSTGEEQAAGTNLLVLSPQSDDIPNQKFEIRFVMDSDVAHEAGTIEAVFPASIWTDRYGDPIGELTLAIPEEPGSNTVDYAWKQIGDNIVITNIRKVASGSQLIKISGIFKGIKGHQMKSGAISDEMNLTVTLVKPDGTTDSLTSGPIQAQINTYASPKLVRKTALKRDQEYYVYDSLSKALAAGMPTQLQPEDAIADENDYRAGKDNYIYVRWYVVAAAECNQYFTMVLQDTPSTTDPQKGVLLGYSGLRSVINNGKTYALPGEEAFLYKEEFNKNEIAAYVWIAYPRTEFFDEETGVDLIARPVKVHNTATIAVKGVDEEDWEYLSSDESMGAVAEATVIWPDDPTVYSITKVWNDNNNQAKHRPASQTIQILKNGFHFKDVAVTAGGDGSWTYTWNDGGYKGDVYSVRELSSASGTEPGYVDNSDPDNPEWVWINWSYVLTGLTKEEVDPYHVKWTVTNSYIATEYRKGVVALQVPGASGSVQKAVVQYNNSAANASTDRFLNELQLGRSFEMSYDLSMDATVMPYTFTTAEGASIRDLTSYSKRPAKILVEDTALYFSRSGSSSTGQKLHAGDYEIASVTMPGFSIYRWGQPDLFTDWRWYQGYTEIENNTFETDDDGNNVDTATCIELYGTSDESGDDNWVRYATRTYYGNPVAEPGSGAVVNGNTVQLPSGVLRVKQEITTRQHRVAYNFRVSFRLLPSEFMVGVATDDLSGIDTIYAVEPVRNTAAMELYAQVNGNMEKQNVSISPVEAYGYVHGRNYRSAAYLDKVFRFTEQDADNSRLVLKVDGTITQQSNVLDRTTYDSEVIDGLPCTMGGTWYDLLPPGIVPDLETIEVPDGHVVLPYVIENYQNTGRTLLVVRVTYDKAHISYTDYSTANHGTGINPIDSDLPAVGYKNTQSISFTCYFPNSELLAYAQSSGYNLNVRNLMAYEADPQIVDGEEVYGIGNYLQFEGEPDNPFMGFNKRSTILNEQLGEMTMMKALDSSRDDKSFVYAVGVCNLTDAVTFSVSSLNKGVTVDGDKWYYGAYQCNEAMIAVYEGAVYSYSLQVSADDDNTGISEVFFYDLLEHGVTNLAETEDVDTPKWKGTLLAVDVTQLRSKGVEPVVYYSTQNVDLSVKPDLSDTTVWTTSPENMSLVKAVAVDASKDSDGNKFELQPGETLVVYLTMRAPLENNDDPYLFTQDEDKDPIDPRNNAFSFNTFYVNSKSGETVTYLRFPTYTKLGILPFELEVTKNWVDSDNNDGLRPESITLRLLANGEPTDNILVMTEENNATDDYNVWKGGFSHVRKFDDNREWIEYTIVEDDIKASDSDELLYEATYQNAIVNNNVTSFTVTNTHTLNKITVPFVKYWEDEDGYTVDRPSSITVRLYQDGTAYNQTRIVRESDDWKGRFISLPQYHNLTVYDDEGNPIVKHGVPYNYTVVEQEVYRYFTSYENNNVYANDEPEEGVSRNDQTAPRIIHNRYWPFGDLTVGKQLTESATPAAREQEFSFTMFLTDEDSNVLQDRYYFIRQDAEGNLLSENGSLLEEPEMFDNNGVMMPYTGIIGNAGIFLLKVGESIHVYNIPSESKYQVTEEAKAGFSVLSATNTEGDILAGRVQAVSFLNNYTASGSASVSLGKELTGADQTRYQFSFNLQGVGNEQENGDTIDTAGSTQDAVSLRAVSTVTDSDRPRFSEAIFPTMHYSEVDAGRTYRYVISEIIPEPIPSGYTYDESRYAAYITVSDLSGNGRLTTNVSFAKIVEDDEEGETEEPVEAVSFVNHYEATGSWQPVVYKTLKGRALEREEFTFEICDEEGNVLSDEEGTVFGRVKNDPYTGDPEADAKPAAGVVRFPEIPFYQNATDEDVGKTFLYVVREHIPEESDADFDATVIYDESVIAFQVTVVDNGDGHLSFNEKRVLVEWDEEAGKYLVVAGEPGNPVFTNNLVDGVLHVTKYTTVAEGTAPDPDQVFNFRIRFTGENLPTSFSYTLDTVENDTSSIDRGE